MAEPNAAEFELQVRFYELDPYGHVNHATYLQYFEAARVHWLSEMGQGLDRLSDQGTSLLVTTVACRFVAPALLGDRVTIETGLIDTKRVQAQWAQLARRGDEVLAAQRINFAAVNDAGRPTRIPGPLLEAMQQFQLRPDWHAKHLPDLAL